MWTMALIKSVFGKRTIRLLFGILLMFALVIINVCIYFSQALKLPEQVTVVVDAGHGGSDPGKVGVSGKYLNPLVNKNKRTR